MRSADPGDGSVIDEGRWAA